MTTRLRPSEAPIPATFDPVGPLPRGTMLVEASAGTGKTYTITTMVVRLIAEEDVPIDEMVLVTFTRAAAAELRGRVRARLREVAEALSVTSDADARRDPVVVHLVASVGATVARQRLRRAMQRFDDATIDTIHGFCQRVLQQLGPEIGVDPTHELQTDIDPLVREIITDLLIRALRHADPGWVAVVTNARLSKGDDLLDALTRAVSTLAGRPYLRRQPASLGDPEQHWRDTVDRLRALWQQQGAALVNWLRQAQADRRFGRKQAYFPAKIDTMEEELNRWAAHSANQLGCPLPDSDALKTAGLASLQVAIDDPGVIPDMEVLVAADATLRLADECVTMFVGQIVADAVAELAARTRDVGVWTFDDLLIQIAQALDDVDRATVVADALKRRFSVAIIDEFQDTDPIQWSIFSRAFGDSNGKSRLVLIGDPKQAIYSFRGADVETYLSAVARVGNDQMRTLTVNHRSDQRLLDGIEQVLDRHALLPSGVFAHPAIQFRHVEASEHHQVDGLRGPHGVSSGLEFRIVTRRHLGVEDGSELGVTRLRPWLARQVAGEIAEFLEVGAVIVDRGPAASGGHRDLAEQSDGNEVAPSRPVRAGDIAVLTRDHRQARLMQDALGDLGIAAVVGTDDSVLDAPEAVAVTRVMAAMLNPSDERRLRAAAASPIVGMTAGEFLSATDEQWDRHVERCRSWAARWHTHGIAEALAMAMADSATAVRHLLTPRGRRVMTNLAHLSELLHLHEHQHALGPATLFEWFVEQRKRPDRRADTLELRLDDDTDAVQITTIHRSKGLQYPVVWCPQLWDSRSVRDREWPLEFHDADGYRTLELTVGEHPSVADAQRRATRQRWEEDLRLAYVAMTRARHRCIVHVAPAGSLDSSALARMLFAAEPSTHNAPAGKLNFEPTVATWPDDDLLSAVIDVAGQGARVTEVQPPHRAAVPPNNAPSAPPLGVRTFDRLIDRTWQRTSFSRMTSSHEDAPHDGPAEQGRDHDAAQHDLARLSRLPTIDDGSHLPPGHPASDSVPMASLPRGAAIGTLVHEVLEVLDFAQASDPAVVMQAIAEVSPNQLQSDDLRQQLAAGIAAAVTTSLGPVFAGVSLSAIGRRDRLDELEFDLPLAGGQRPKGRPVDLGTLAEVFAAHAGDDPVLNGTAQRLRSRPSRPAYGFLTGSIDLVARVEGRWMIADYKSNWIGQRTPDGQERSILYHYRHSALVEQMIEHDYTVQLHLYQVALHRYLRWRLPDYDYDTHMLGAAYLFLRGMTGSSQQLDADGRPYGVYALRPSRALIDDLDTVLRGER